MASSLALLCLALVAFFYSAAAAASYTKFQFYMHDDYNTSQPSALHIAGPPFLLPPLNSFGALSVFDDLLTEGPSKSSTVLGRGQGTYLACALDNTATFMSFTAAFSAGEHNGSSFNIQGLDRFFIPGRELAVTGGTGKFRYSSGYANLYTYLVANGSSTFLFNGTIRTPSE